MQEQRKYHKEDSDIGFKNYDFSSFSQLLKKVMTSSNPPGFQGQNEMFQRDAQVGAKPEADRGRLEHEAECAHTSSEALSVTPAAIPVPHSASVTQKPMSKCELGLVIDQQNSHHEIGLPRVVMDAPFADGYNWRKYGQKSVKGSKNSRSYYRCVHSICNAKKKVQHCCQSGRVVDVVYIGDHNHDAPHRKCIRVISSAKPTVGSQIADPSVQKLDQLDSSVCSADGRRSSLHVPESEQQSSSSSNGNVGARIEEKNSDESESKRCFAPRAVGPQQNDPCGIACSGVQEKHGAEPRLKIRIKERSAAHSVPVLKKEPEIAVNAVPDEGSSNDGYRWRKYGQKMLKGNSFIRSYYRCTSSGCPARKHVERAVGEATSTTITYEGKHDHGMPVPKRRQGSESCLISPAATTDDACCKKNRILSSLEHSSKFSVESAVDLMDEKILELGDVEALESAQTLLSIGGELKPC
ncbi:WRKY TRANSCRIPTION FACTOR PROTEIN 1-RELATED [Salix purpurea]|uniref:WRKY TRANSCRIPTION FACTOR PROTEIN 1-RELATED n=1 Tax=Salix purpurea TaxID=77065 RepID=A0A9Q0Q0E6_SALPP|nr:WRKY TRANSCRIPTION FACTOR PROTEIN 1-RELATED [Salix purpurea]